jgi:hypothetical protein
MQRRLWGFVIVKREIDMGYWTVNGARPDEGYSQ